MPIPGVIQILEGDSGSSYDRLGSRDQVIHQWGIVEPLGRRSCKVLNLAVIRRHCQDRVQCRDNWEPGSNV